MEQYVPPSDCRDLEKIGQEDRGKCEEPVHEEKDVSFRDMVIKDQIATLDARIKEIRSLPRAEQASELRRQRARFHPDNKDPSLHWLFEALSKHINQVAPA